MIFHCDESASQKTLNFTGYNTYVKENYTSSREKMTIYIQVTNEFSIKLLSGFLFKAKRTRTKVASPESMHYQWAPKRSYRIEQLLKGISHLRNRFGMFLPKNYTIYALDDYSVHLLP